MVLAELAISASLASGDHLRGLADPRQRREPLVGHGDVADIGLDRAEGIIGRLRRRGLGERVEKRGLAHIGKPDNAAFKAHDDPVSCTGLLLPAAVYGQTRANANDGFR